MPYVNPQPKTINTYAPNGTGTYSFTFEYELDTDVWVGVYDTNTKKFKRVLKDDAAYPWTLKTATSIEFTKGDPGVNVIIYRSTDINNPISEFYTGSAIRAQDLNDNFEQLLFAAQELTDQTKGLNGVNDDLQDQIDDINAIIQDLVGVEILKDVAALNAFTPTNLDTPIQVLDSTDWSDADDVTGTPAGFTGASDLRVNLRTTSISPKAYTFVNYTAANPDDRYVNRAGDNMTGNLTIETNKVVLNKDGSASFAKKATSEKTVSADSDTTLTTKSYVDSNITTATQNLGYTANANNAGKVTITEGTDATIPVVTDSVAGLMTGTLKQKLDGLNTNSANDTRYVQVAGDNMTGNLTFDTNKIILNKDGSATFGTKTSTSQYLSWAATPGLEIRTTSTSATDAVFRIYSDKTPAGSVGITFNADGGGVFSGKVTSAATASSDGNTTLTTKGYVDGLVAGDVDGLWETSADNPLKPIDISKDIQIGDSSSFRSFDTFKDLIEFVPADFIRDHAVSIAALDLDQSYSLDSVTDQPFRTAIENITRATTAGMINLNADGSASFAKTKVNIDTTGRLLINTTNAADNARLGAGVIQANVGENHAGVNLTQYTESPSVAPFIDLKRSRGTTDGSKAAVLKEDELGFLVWHGTDGDLFRVAATITAKVDKDPEKDSMPGRILFSTSAVGSATPTERMRIDSSGDITAPGRLGIGTTNFDNIAENKLMVSGSGTVITRCKATNNGGQAQIYATNNAAKVAGPIIYGSGVDNYGALLASESAFYSNVSVTIMSDNSNGVIKFATGGNTERMRIDNSGNITAKNNVAVSNSLTTGNINLTAPNNSGVKLAAGGSVDIQSPQSAGANTEVFGITYGTAKKAYFTNSGTATFEGRVSVNNDIAVTKSANQMLLGDGTSYIVLNANSEGPGDAGALQIKAANGDDVVCQFQSDALKIGTNPIGDPKITLKTDGNAIFTGTVTAAKYDLDSLTQLT